MKFDKTEVFNVIATVGAILLAGGDTAGIDMTAIPPWAMPVMILVIVLINTYSRLQVKREVPDTPKKGKPEGEPYDIEEE